MNIYNEWTKIKCPSYKFLKSEIPTTGDVIVVSDQKKFLIEHAEKYLSAEDFKVFKSSPDKNLWTYSKGNLNFHFYLFQSEKDRLVGSFESSHYYAFKKFFGLKLTPLETTFSLVLDENFKFADIAVQAFSESVCSVSYSFKQKTKVELNIGLKKVYQKTFKEQFLKSQAVTLARYLVDLPPNVLNPTTYSDFIQELVKKSKFYKFESITKNLSSAGYGLIQAVGQGSKNPPQLIRVLSSSKSAKTVLVGKGITFDTGGLDLKPSKFMRNMKKDMGGSATVLSVLFYLIESNQNLDLDFYLALAENSMDGDSFRPGDIHTAGNGLTVEIDNTDAEGRLVLADALSWLGKEKVKPKTIIDVATLTGAIKVGLGSYVGGLFSNSKKLSDQLFESSMAVGDFLWPMPMPFWTESEMTKSEVADLVNSSQSGYGGAITAAQFLKFFIPEGSQWAHLDIYSWVDSKKDVLRMPGGSGQGVMSLIHWIETHLD